MKISTIISEDAILYEDNHLLVINKRAGLLVQGDKTGDITLVDVAKEYLKRKYNKPGKVFLGLTHRLDRPVSGCLILARTSKALSRINQQFRKGIIEKKYLAICSQPPLPEEAQLRHYLLKDAKRNLVQIVDVAKSNAKEATLRYRLLASKSSTYLLLVRPLTGRPHQIRVQLASIGCTILGDIKYGAKTPLTDRSIALHCYEMSFQHPTKGERITVMCTPPATMPWLVFKDYLRGGIDA